MAGVFVSYAREDAPKAKAMARFLEEASLDVWLDERLHSGSEFSREIEAALAAASAVVVLWSRASIESPWVRDEASEGRDSGRLVSVLLDDCRPPIGFRQFQTTDLSNWSGRGKPRQIDSVIAAVQAKHGAPKAATAAAPAAAPSPRRSLLWGTAAGAALLLAIAGGLLFNPPRGRSSTPLVVAVLPFTADATDAEGRKVAAAARDSVAHTLSLGAFAVSVVENRSQAPKADFLISGQVASSKNEVTATVRMQETSRDVVVFSHQFETARDKAADFAEAVGAQVASQLSWTAPLIAMERRHPSDPAIVASILQSSSAGLDSVGALEDFEKARRLAAKAPDSPLAQNGLGFSTAFAVAELPREQRAEAVAAARRAAERAVKLAPEFGDNYIPWCLLRSEQRRIECEDRLRRAMRTDPDAPFVSWFLAFTVLNPVGRNQEATELARLSLAHDQYMPFKIALAVRMFELTGRTDEAASLYTQATRWWPDNETIAWYRFAGMLQRGDFRAAQRFDDERGGAAWSSPVLSAINGGSLAGMRTACSTAEEIQAIMCILALARSGDYDGAYKIAAALYPTRRGRSPADEEAIWLDDPNSGPVAFLTAPAAAPLRRDRRYLALAERVGLLEYWRSGRPPDFCRPPSPEPICRSLLARA